MKKLIFLFILLIILITGILAWKYILNKEPDMEVSSFEECLARGYPVLESYPRRCKTPDGKSFSEDIGNELEKIDFIRLEKPRPNQVISSPLEIKGEARGFWFFEASFPVKLLDGNGKELAVNPPYIQAKGDWMTEDFVPFEAIIEFEAPGTKKGTLILEKDNPSGLPENADSLIIPLNFY